MIHEMLEIVRTDVTVLTHWMRGEELELSEMEEVQQQRVQLAGFRMIAAIAMVFGALWALQIVTFVITFPIKIMLKLALAVSFYVIAHDIFVMSQNYARPDFTPQKSRPHLLRLFKGQEINEDELAFKFTHGTYVQPLWMWLYANRAKVNLREKKSEYV